MADSSFPRDKHLTAIAVGYRNPDVALIGDAVLPRVPVGKKLFNWTEYPVEQGYSVPETELSEYAKIGSSRVSGARREASCVDQAWSIPLSRDDIDQAPPDFKPEEVATTAATDIVIMRRELRIAQLVFDANKYAASNKVAVAAADKFTAVATSDPIKYMRARMATCLVRPNVVAFGADPWEAFCTHPKVVSAALGNDGQNGVAPRERVAELLGVNEVLVGEGFVNTAKPGKPVNMARAWGSNVLAFYRNRAASTQGGLTFGFTAEFERRQAGAKDIDIGARGGREVRVFETVKELIVAPAAAFYFENAI